MGYAGGDQPDPTYRNIGDHTEVFQVEFDSAAISYEELLELFWQSHDPRSAAWKTQYASMILAHTDDQLAIAKHSAEQFESLFGREVHTRIERLKRFYLAEDYHQKYYLQNDRLLNPEFRGMYPVFDSFRDSAAAARVNGYLYGAAPCARLERELPRLGVSAKAADRLRERCA